MKINFLVLISNTLKDAKLTNGLDVKVPTFIKIGDKIRIDTRTNEYMSASPEANF